MFLGVLSDIDNGVLSPRLVGQQVEQLFVVQLEEGDFHQKLRPGVASDMIENILGSLEKYCLESKDPDQGC